MVKYSHIKEKGYSYKYIYIYIYKYIYIFQEESFRKRQCAEMSKISFFIYFASLIIRWIGMKYKTFSRHFWEHCENFLIIYQTFLNATKNLWSWRREFNFSIYTDACSKDQKFFWKTQTHLKYTRKYNFSKKLV